MSKQKVSHMKKTIIHTGKGELAGNRLTMQAWCLLPMIVLFLLCPVKGQDELPENPLKGRYVFEQKGCIGCHNQNGSGPDLVENEFYGTSLELAATMWNHLPRMVLEISSEGLSFPNFTSQEFSDLLTYLFYLRYLGKPGDSVTGEKLFSEKSCNQCHAISSNVKKDGPDLSELASYVSPLSLASALWNHGPIMNEILSDKGIARPVFRKSELVDIHAYIRAAGDGTEGDRYYQSPGNPASGKRLFQVKQCSKCHSLATGAESGSGPNLQDRKWGLSVYEIAGILWNHEKTMTSTMEEQGLAYPEFTTDEMADIIAYIYFMGFRDRKGDPENGKTAFQDRGCTNCHQLRDEGPISNIRPSLNITTSVTMAQIMWNHAPVMEKMASGKVLPWPELTGDDMVDIYAFLLSELSRKTR